jgi:hypothetical protein
MELWENEMDGDEMTRSIRAVAHGVAIFLDL